MPLVTTTPASSASFLKRSLMRRDRSSHCSIVIAALATLENCSPSARTRWPRFGTRLDQLVDRQAAAVSIRDRAAGRIQEHAWQRGHGSRLAGALCGSADAAIRPGDAVASSAASDDRRRRGTRMARGRIRRVLYAGLGQRRPVAGALQPAGQLAAASSGRRRRRTASMPSCAPGRARHVGAPAVGADGRRFDDVRPAVDGFGESDGVHVSVSRRVERCAPDDSSDADAARKRSADAKLHQTGRSAELLGQ